MKSDRLSLILFLSVLAIIFAFLFYIFGGDSNNRIDQVQNTYIEDDMLDEDDLDEDLDVNRRRFRTSYDIKSGSTTSGSSSSSDSDDDTESSYSSSGSSGSYGSSSSGSSGSYGSSLAKKHHTSVFYEYYRKPKKLNPLEKAQRVRDRLRKKGFKNEEYIEMKALEATNYEAKAALKTALRYTNSDSPEKAIELLEDQLAELNPKDLKTRGKIQNALMMIYSNFGYPDKWKEVMQHNLALRQKVINIQKNTILADNPRYQDVLSEQENMMAETMKSIGEGGAADSFINHMVQNGGSPPELQNASKAALINLSSQSKGQMSIKDVNKSYKSIEQTRSKHWANPK
ncbi:MAG: hypothetical protein KC646_14590 [Candidatus Cloacimonetes bacterium]|nr:hypothetical protein [Candidatus Cloacimonadota bacterium]